MLSRRVSLVVAGLLLAGLTGCTPIPAPTPTPTGFASEDEAFAAAEETFAAYIDATNAVDLADTESFEPLFGWTTGDENATQRENLSELHALGWTVSGTTKFAGFKGVSYTANEVVAVTCLDVSDVDVVDSEGVSQVAPSRNDLQPIEVRFADAPTATGLAVARTTSSEQDTCES